MAGPPNDVPASELWLKLQQRPRPSDVVDLPCKDGEGKPLGQIRIQVLAQEQHDEARQRAQKLLVEQRKYPLEQLKTDLMREVLGDTVAREVLALACLSVNAIPNTDPPRYARIFPDGPSIGQKLTADEIGVLFTQYTMVQNKFGPYEGNVANEDELNAWIKRLAEGASAYPLAQLDLLALIALCMSLARRSYTLSVALESQLSSLPDTLRSALEALGFGTGYFSKPPAELPTPDSESSELLINPDEPMDIETAARIARDMHKSGR